MESGLIIQNCVVAYLGLGANLGDREATLRTALSSLSDLPTIQVSQVSSLYETAAVGVTDQPDFLNAVAKISTSLSATALLGALLNLENLLGRVRTLRWGPRVIDLDLLLYGEAQIALPELIVPHPRLRERAFVLVPLSEIAPEMVLPGDTQTVQERANYFRGDGNIRCMGTV